VCPWVKRKIKGSESSVIKAMDHMAPIQPKISIKRCKIGGKTNWPIEPPALITPDAEPRD